MHLRRLHILGKFALATAIAGLVGAGSAYFAVDRGTVAGVFRSGPWSGWTEAGAPDADPYTRARMARGLQLRLNPKEGYVLSAVTDSAGLPLQANCTYAIAGGTLPARLWTLSLYDRQGRPFANPSDRYGFHSRELLRDANGTFEIIAARRVRPGNWLALGEGEFAAVLRLYDTGESTPGRDWENQLPTIARGECQ